MGDFEFDFFNVRVTNVRNFIEPYVNHPTYIRLNFIFSLFNCLIVVKILNTNMMGFLPILNQFLGRFPLICWTLCSSESLVTEL